MSTPAAAVLEGGGSGAGAAQERELEALVRRQALASYLAGQEEQALDLLAVARALAAPPPMISSGPAGQPQNRKTTRDWVANKNYADTFTLAKTARELEREAATLRSQVSLKGYPVDKVNADGTVTKADENQRKAWNATMGVPESPDKYEIPLPPITPIRSSRP